MEANTRLGSVTTRVRGLSMHALVSTGPEPDTSPLVLIAGLVVASRYMAPTARRLAPYHRVYAPDLPGVGGSGKPERALDVPQLAEFLAAWMDSVGLDRASFLGNSFGCQVVVELALCYPGRVERVVLQAPVVDPAARTPAQQIARRLRTLPQDRPALFPPLAHAYLVADIPRALATLKYTLRYPIECRLSLMQAPALVVRGSLDAIVPQRWAEEATRLLPDGRLAVIPGVAHAIPFNAPGDLARVSLSFLNGAEDGP